jgi:DHA1 family multidrug resistance protein-like MFS transporter
MATVQNELPWRRNLAMLWIAQNIVALGFTFTFPAFPFFFQELGIGSPERAAFISGISGSVMGFGLVLSSPVWGVLSDRYGRKLNVVRAMLLLGVVLFACGFAENVTQLMIGRFLSGLVGGIQGAMFALVASSTPSRRTSFSIGVMQSSIFLGTTLGPPIGGAIFDAYGMREAFTATGAAMMAGALIVMLTVKEDFRPPVRVPGHPFQPFINLGRMAFSAQIWPLLVIVLLIHGSHHLMFPALPVIAQKLYHGSSPATASGMAFMALGLGSAASAVVTGWLGGRLGIKKVISVSCFFAAIAAITPIFANSMLTLVILMGVLGLFEGGLIGGIGSLIATTAPGARMGAVFGATQASQAIALTLSPAAAGLAVELLGPGSVFVLVSFLFLAVAFMVLFILKNVSTTSIE